MPKKVLFISHDALRTGAPLFLLNLLKWFGTNSELAFRILLKNGGDLESEFQALAPISVYNRDTSIGNKFYTSARPIAYFRALANSFHRKKLKNDLMKENFDLVYSNTITNGEVLEFLSGLKCPVITHVHELDYWIQKAGPGNLDQVRRCTQLFIVVSEAVKRNLVCNHNIPEELIEVAYGFIPTSEQHNSAPEGNLRKTLNIPDNACVVGSSGYETWRKGKDLFTQLALNTVSKYRDRPVHFVWIGGRTDDENFSQIRYDMAQSGIADKIHFISHVPNPLDYFREFDIFAMTSREDPFPLVNLEVAALGKPIVCFDNAGGTPEFVGNDAGFVVPYLDISAMADKIIVLAQDDELRKQMGHAGFVKVMKHHDVSVGGAKILKAIERLI